LKTVATPYQGGLGRTSPPPPSVPQSNGERPLSVQLYSLELHLHVYSIKIWINLTPKAQYLQT
jgi:hypothetical protein